MNRSSRDATTSSPRSCKYCCTSSSLSFNLQHEQYAASSGLLGAFLGQAAPMPGCICAAVHEQVQQGRNHLITQILQVLLYFFKLELQLAA